MNTKQCFASILQGSTYNHKCRIAKYKEPHTIGEELILPTAEDFRLSLWSVSLLDFPHLL